MKGTPSMGKKSSGKLHIMCRRCGKRSYHMKKGVCASCGYGASSKLRNYNWMRSKVKSK